MLVDCLLSPLRTRTNDSQATSIDVHDPPLGKWIKDKTVVRAMPPQKLSFRNYDDPIGSTYEAVGEMSGENGIVGVWRETLHGATAHGKFHLYIDRFGQKAYGVCTGPTSNGQHVYRGWLLVRERNKLNEARSANLVGGSSLPGQGFRDKDLKEP